jgi:hypothetical protein
MNGLGAPEVLAIVGIYLVGVGASFVAVWFFLRALWRIGDALYSISRAIASKQAGKDSD